MLDAGADPACAYETIDVTEDEYYSDTCNGICHGDPKNALNCAYLNMAFSEHDYFDLWSPCAFWTVHRLFDKATRKKNYRDIHYCSACVGEHIRKVYAVSKEHTSLSLRAKKSINFAYPDPGNPPKPNDAPCFIVVCDSTTLIVNVYLFCYCDDSFSDFTGAVPVELPADIAGQKITDLRGRRSGFQADSNDNLTIVLENGKALGITDAATVERLQLTAVPVISKVRKENPLPSSVFRSGFLKSKWWKDS